jgi:hypothetical protein
MLLIAVELLVIIRTDTLSRSKQPQFRVCFCRQHQMAIVKQVSGTANTQYTQNLSDTDHSDCAPS